MRPLLLAVAAALVAVVAPAPAAADEAEWLFEPTHVAEIDLVLSDASVAALDGDPDEYVPASFSVVREGTTTYGPLTIGVKLKGTSSFRTLAGKAAFKLKFNEFVSGQTFLGLKKLTLNNMVQDPTMLHETLAYEAFRAAGVLGWRSGFSYVRVNGDDFGVYLTLETPDKISLARWFASTQHLYEGESVDVRPGDAPRFEVDEGDDEDLADLAALIAAASDGGNLESVADLEQMTRFWAVEKYIGHWDGYSAGHPTPNNYYLHSDAGGRFSMLPWGTDQTFGVRLAYGDPGGLLFNRCLADTSCESLYRAAVDDVRATLAAHDLDLLASDAAALLYPWQRMDPRKETSMAQIREAILDLHLFLDARPADTTWRTPLAAQSGDTAGPEPDTPADPPQSPEIPAPSPLAPAPEPGRSASSLSVARVTLHARPLRGGRVRLFGSVKPRQAAARIVIQRRVRGRFVTLARARLTGASATRSAFAVTLQRRAGVYRALLPANGGQQGASARLRVAR